MINSVSQILFGSEMGINTATKVEGSANASFGDILGNLIGEAETTQAQFAASSDAVLSGDVDNLHQVTIDAEKAQTALNLVVTVRDKAIESYQQIMQMSL